MCIVEREEEDWLLTVESNGQPLHLAAAYTAICWVWLRDRFDNWGLRIYVFRNGSRVR